MKHSLFLFLFIATVTGHTYGQKQFCTTVIPPNVTSFDTTHFRGMADNYFLWNNGQKITVKFLSGSQLLRKKIFSIAQEWETYANIHFVYVTTGPANIRVNLDNKGGHNSLIGTLANSVIQGQKTMNLDTMDFVDQKGIRRIVLHEFGHVLGLLHEHFSPLSGISWNETNVYKDLYASNGWDKHAVDANIFEKYSVSYTNGTLYDPASIMHYPIPSNWTTNNYSVDWNNELSAGDKSLIAALYPKSGKREHEVPRFQVSSQQPLEIINSNVNKGLFIYPKFSLATAGKEGMVYFVVFFYDSNGQPIKAKGSDYNINNAAAVFKTATVPPNLHLQANKTSHNLELFIPYSAFPLPDGKNNIVAKFSVFLSDNNELKLLSSSKPVKCIVIK